ncbi:MAG: FG-GAP repeat protein, partial [Thermoplasmata archaeon]|nr:FG-GAP repeat protein [Thermoplasmata archaeon]
MHPKSGLKTKMLIQIILFILIFSIFNGGVSNFVTKPRAQPINALDDLESGVGALTNDYFGWNVSYAGNLNGDIYDDIIVGAPGNDSNGKNSGAVYVFYGNASPKTTGLDPSNADIVLTGLAPGDNFGWDVACAGDVNGDGHEDIIVGAPGYSAGKGKAYTFYGGTLANVTAESADVILNGTIYGEAFGSSVEGAGDIDNDNFDDVIVGAPGSNRAYIFYGQATHQISFIDLWDEDADKLTPETDFTSGLNSTGTTMDYTGDDDGWDWQLINAGPYGGDTSAVEYNADPNRDGNHADSTVAIEENLIISIGDDFGNGAHGGSPDSGAYGVGFEITSEQAAILSSGGNAYISFDYYFDDYGTGTYRELDLNEEIWIKCRFGQATMTYIGYNLDGSDNNADGTVEVYWDNNPNDISWRTFSYKITNLIAGAGTYYLDFGGKVRTWANLGGSTENGIFHFDNILLTFSNQKRPTILGGPAGTAFGTSVAGLNNFNGDIPSYDDVAVGAPFSVRGHTYVFFGDTNLPNYIAVANSDVTLTGMKDGELFGWSVAGAGDINNDNFGDLLVGAPGGDRAYVHFGKPSFTVPAPMYPILWDDNEATPNTVTFDFLGDEVNSTGNTFGLGATPSANDDGWDWANGTYGQDLKGNPSMAHHYDPEPETENVTLDNSKRLEVQVGPSHAGNDGSNQELMDSAAWGVQFDMTPPLANAVIDGGEAYLSIGWQAMDTEIAGSGTEEASYVKARLHTPTGVNYLGNNLGGDPEPEILYRASSGNRNNPWGPVSGWFLPRISNLITQSGWHYIDFGVKFDPRSGTQTVREGIRAYFDNIVIVIFPRIQHDIIINGTAGEKFGFSVSGAGRVNIDNFDDIIIGAPDNTNTNGGKSGAIYVFAGGATLSSELDAGSDAIHINYGESPYDVFGRAVSDAGSVDGDLRSELFVGAPYSDSTASQVNTGKAYVLSALKRPKISLNYPIGGEILNGVIDINVTATDSDNNIDGTGVRFQYSTDLITWTLLGNDPAPDLGKFYTRSWDTATVKDDVYYIKVDVTDLDMNKRWDTSGSFVIDNQHQPIAQLKNPHQDEIMFGQYQINASGHDSPLDTNGGGINETLGMQFYLSADNSTWELLGNDNSTPADGQYQYGLDTTILFDGRYWLKVNITDIDDLVAGDLVEFEIDNPS